MKKLWFFALAALALVSCVREWTPESAQTAEDGLVERTWTVAMHDGMRATLDEGMYPVWEAGEQVAVYDHVAKTVRAFTVQSVDGSRATISGSISAGGDTPFDAVFPLGGGVWAEDGTVTLTLPAAQPIPAGRNVCPGALVSEAHADSPEGKIVFHNIGSLLKVDLSREGISEVRLSLTGASSTDVHRYQATAATGTLATGTYFIAVDPGTYAGGVSITCVDPYGIEYDKSSTAPLEAAAGGFLNLGTISDGAARRYYQVFDEKTYTSLEAMLNEAGYSISQLGDYASMAGLLFDLNRPVRAINYTYRSVDPQGNPTTLSARIFIPSKVLTGTSTKLTGIGLGNHGTMASNAECPTMIAQFEGAFAWKSPKWGTATYYAIVMPDYYGFGVSKDRPQAYLDPETTARGNIDAYLCALQLLRDRKVTIPSTVYNAGYSQGGFNAMANLRYVTLHPDLGVTFNKTFCGGSPFDVEETWRSYLATHYDNAIGFVPLTLVSFNEAQQLGIPYDHIFKGPLLENYADWILSKNYHLNAVKTKIGTTELSDILTPEMMNGTGADFEKIIAVCRRFSLTSGWTPPESTWMYIYHSKGDDSVPYANFTKMKEFLGTPSSIHYDGDSDDGGHVDGAIAFLTNIIINSYW